MPKDFDMAGQATLAAHVGMRVGYGPDYSLWSRFR